MMQNKIEVPGSVLDEAKEALKARRRVFVLRRGDEFKVAASGRLPRGWTLVSELRDYDFYTDTERYDNYVAAHGRRPPWWGGK